MKKTILLITMSLIASHILCAADTRPASNAITLTIEEHLWYISEEAASHDCPTEEELNTPPVPLRERDAIKEHLHGYIKMGWTTNQLINTLIQVYSNNIDAVAHGVDTTKDLHIFHAADRGLGENDNCIIAGMALDMLEEINLPQAQNFIKVLITNDMRAAKYTGVPINGIFMYSNFEPEVMNYMRNVCVMTNVYDGLAYNVADDMFRCATNVPPLYRANAISNVAKYVYFSVLNTSQDVICADLELARRIPEYSNSVQRIEAMRHISASTTNDLSRAWSIRERDRLTALPTNELNNLTWLLEDYK